MDFSHNLADTLCAPRTIIGGMIAHDLEHGNRLELDWLTGTVVTLGRELKVPTPASDAVYAVLKLHRMGRAAETPTLAPSA